MIIRRCRRNHLGFFGIFSLALASLLAGTLALADDEPAKNANLHPFTPQMIGKASQFKAPNAPEQGAMPAIKQTHYSDGWFEAALCAVAMSKQGQEVISKMIWQKKLPGHYTVTFPGRHGSSQFINPDILGEAKLGNKEKWANIIEAALGKLYPDLATQRAGTDTINGAFGLKLLTGTRPTVVNLAEQNSDAKIGELLTLMEGNLHDSVPMVTTTKEKKAQPFSAKQTFAVVACDKKNKEIVLRNPFGTDLHAQSKSATNLGGGNVKMPVKTWLECFNTLTYAKFPD